MEAWASIADHRKRLTKMNKLKVSLAQLEKQKIEERIKQHRANKLGVYLFTFFSQTAVKKRFSAFRDWMVARNVSGAKEIIVHDFRKIALIQIDSAEGLKQAQRMAQHSSMSVTFNNYLRCRYDRGKVKGFSINTHG